MCPLNLALLWKGGGSGGGAFVIYERWLVRVLGEYGDEFRQKCLVDMNPK